MREILFRGKATNRSRNREYRTRYKNGDWVYGLLTDAENYAGFAEMTNTNGVSGIEVDKNTIGQYTGLTDHKDTKIFEGDICRFREWSNGEMCWVGKVHFEHQQFVISGDKNKECETSFTLVMSRFISENIEVIGNIHDNPELLQNT